MALATSRSNLGRRVGFATIVALVGACGGGSKPAPKPAQPEILAEGRFDDSRLGTALVLVRSDEPTGVTLFASAVPLHLPFEPAELLPDMLQRAGADGYLLRFTGERFATVSELPEAKLPENSNRGWSMAALGDLDGDGHPDLAVGVPRLLFMPCLDSKEPSGLVQVLSGRDGKVLFELTPTTPNTRFGWSLAVERTDTKKRLAVGAPSAPERWSCRSIRRSRATVSDRRWPSSATGTGTIRAIWSSATRRRRSTGSDVPVESGSSTAPRAQNSPATEERASPASTVVLSRASRMSTKTADGSFSSALQRVTCLTSSAVVSR
jgi:hypothetical protein